MFETFSVPALNIQIQAVLSMYASGRINRIVIESGNGVAQTLAVHEGYAISKSISRLDWGGKCTTLLKNVIWILEKCCFQTCCQVEIQCLPGLKFYFLGMASHLGSS